MHQIRPEAEEQLEHTTAVLESVPCIVSRTLGLRFAERHLQCGQPVAHASHPVEVSGTRCEKKRCEGHAQILNFQK